MTKIVRTTALSIGLLTGVAFAAQAQSNNVAALPPAAPAAAPTAPVASPMTYPGPNPGTGFYGGLVQQQQPVVQSGKLEGPAPGGAWSTPEKQTQAVVPSAPYPGPRPN
jgi:hypothetical protein